MLGSDLTADEVLLLTASLAYMYEFDHLKRDVVELGDHLGVAEQLQAAIHVRAHLYPNSEFRPDSTGQRRWTEPTAIPADSCPP
jgi:hypothetical protein